MTEPSERDRELYSEALKRGTDRWLNQKGYPWRVLQSFQNEECISAIAEAREVGQQEVLRTIALDDVGLVIVPRDSPERWREEGRQEERARCAEKARAAVRMLEYRPTLKFVTPEKFASDLALDIADAIERGDDTDARIRSGP